MKRVFFTCLILLVLICGLTHAETRMLKITVDSLPGENELGDNIIETEVIVSGQTFSDMKIIDILVSPAYITGSATVTVRIPLKNIGSDETKNIYKEKGGRKC